MVLFALISVRFACLDARLHRHLTHRNHSVIAIPSARRTSAAVLLLLSLPPRPFPQLGSCWMITLTSFTVCTATGAA